MTPAPVVIVPQSSCLQILIYFCSITDSVMHIQAAHMHRAVLYYAVNILYVLHDGDMAHCTRSRAKTILLVLHVATAEFGADKQTKLYQPQRKTNSYGHDQRTISEDKQSMCRSYLLGIAIACMGLVCIIYIQTKHCQLHKQCQSALQLSGQKVWAACSCRMPTRLQSCQAACHSTCCR